MGFNPILYRRLSNGASTFLVPPFFKTTKKSICQWLTEDNFCAPNNRGRSSLVYPLRTDDYECEVGLKMIRNGSIASILLALDADALVGRLPLLL